VDKAHVVVHFDNHHFIQINVREYRRGNQNWSIQRNWQHSVHKTKVSRVEQELPTLPEYLGSSPDFSGVRVAQTFVFSVLSFR
jgi:hypothetical protein